MEMKVRNLMKKSLEKMMKKDEKRYGSLAA